MMLTPIVAALLLIPVVAPQPPLPDWQAEMLARRPKSRASVHRSGYPEDAALRAAGAGLAQAPISAPVVVGMTTTPTRIAHVEPAILSLLNQSQPCVVVLNVPDRYNERRNHWNGKRVSLPPWLAALDKAARRAGGPRGAGAGDSERCAFGRERPPQVRALRFGTFYEERLRPGDEARPRSRVPDGASGQRSRGAAIAIAGRRPPRTARRSGRRKRSARTRPSRTPWAPRTRTASSSSRRTTTTSGSPSHSRAPASATSSARSTGPPRQATLLSVGYAPGAATRKGAGYDAAAAVWTYYSYAYPRSAPGVPGPRRFARATSGRARRSNRDASLPENQICVAQAGDMLATAAPNLKALEAWGEELLPGGGLQSCFFVDDLFFAAYNEFHGATVYNHPWKLWLFREAKRRKLSKEPAFEPCRRGGCSPVTIRLRYPDGLAMGHTRETHSENCARELAALGWWPPPSGAAKFRDDLCRMGDF